LGKAIKNVELKTVREPSREPCVERVVVCVYVRRRNVDREREEVGRYHRLDEPLIDEPNQLVTRAALIADGRGEFERQLILYVERIAVDVRYRCVGECAVDLNLTTLRCARGRIDANRECGIRWITERRTARAELVKNLMLSKRIADGAAADR